MGNAFAVQFPLPPCREKRRKVSGKTLVRRSTVTGVAESRHYFLFSTTTYFGAQTNEMDEIPNDVR